MEVDGHGARLPPDPQGNLVHQGRIQTLLRVRQVCNAQWLVEIGADSLGVRCANQVSADRFEGAAMGSDTRQRIEQVIRTPYIAIHSPRRAEAGASGGSHARSAALSGRSISVYPSAWACPPAIVGSHSQSYRIWAGPLIFAPASTSWAQMLGSDASTCCPCAATWRSGGVISTRRKARPKVAALGIRGLAGWSCWGNSSPWRLAHPAMARTVLCPLSRAAHTRARRKRHAYCLPRAWASESHSAAQTGKAEDTWSWSLLLDVLIVINQVYPVRGLSCLLPCPNSCPKLRTRS